MKSALDLIEAPSFRITLGAALGPGRKVFPSLCWFVDDFGRYAQNSQLIYLRDFSSGSGYVSPGLNLPLSQAAGPRWFQRHPAGDPRGRARKLDPHHYFSRYPRGYPHQFGVKKGGEQAREQSAKILSTVEDNFIPQNPYTPARKKVWTLIAFYSRIIFRLGQEISLNSLSKRYLSGR
jgi:hypothetical protein